MWLLMLSSKGTVWAGEDVVVGVMFLKCGVRGKRSGCQYWANEKWARRGMKKVLVYNATGWSITTRNPTLS